MDTVSADEETLLSGAAALGEAPPFAPTKEDIRYSNIMTKASEQALRYEARIAEQARLLTLLGNRVGEAVTLLKGLDPAALTATEQAVLRILTGHE